MKCMFVGLALLLLAVHAQGWVGVQVVSTYGKTRGTATASVSTNGVYTFLAYRGNGLVIANVSSTGEVTEVGKTSGTSMYSLHAIEISGTSNLMVAENKQGITMWNISDPTSPSLLKKITTNDIFHLVQVGDYVYGACMGLLCTYNVTDPNNPVWLGKSGSNRCRSIYLYHQYAVMSCVTRIRIFDFSTPGSPLLVSTTTGLSAHYSGYVDVDNSLYYAASRTTSLRVYNISDPLAPVLLSSAGPGMVGDIAKIDEQYLLFSGYSTNPNRIVDYASSMGSVQVVEEFGFKYKHFNAYYDPQGLMIMGRLNNKYTDIYQFRGLSYGSQVTMDTSATKITDLALVDDHLYASSLGSRMLMDYNITDVSQFVSLPSLHGSLGLSTKAGSIEIVDDGSSRYALLAARGIHGYTAVDATDSANMTIVRQWGRYMNPLRHISNGFMAVGRTAGYMRHVLLINATELENPEVISKTGTGSKVLDLETDGSHVFTVTKSGQLITFEFNTTSPALNQVDSVAVSGSLQAHLSKDEQTLFIGSSTGKVHIFDISSGIPSLLSVLALPAQLPIKATYQSNSVLFVGTDYGYAFADISDLSNPQYTSMTDIGDQVTSFRVSHPYVFMGTNSGLRVLQFDSSELSPSMVDASHGTRDVHYASFVFPPPEVLSDISSSYPSSGSSSSIWSTSDPEPAPVLYTSEPDSSSGSPSPSTSSSSTSSTDSVSGGATGDPHVYGFHGQRFDVYGEAGKSYLFFESPELSVVTTFISGTTTASQTFIGAIAMHFKSGSLDQLAVQCDAASRSIQVTRSDGTPVNAPAVSTTSSGMVYIWEKSQTTVVFETTDATIEVDRMHSKGMECYLNLQVNVASMYSTRPQLVGGILGTTLHVQTTPVFDIRDYEV